MLQALPSLSSTGDIGTSLVKSEQQFFLKRSPSLRMNRNRIVGDGDASQGKFGLQAMQCQVWILSEPVRQ